MTQQNVKGSEEVTSPPLWIIDKKYDGRSSFTVRETAEILGISVWSAWDAAKRGDLPVISIGRRKIVPRVRLERLMNGNVA